MTIYTYITESINICQHRSSRPNLIQLIRVIYDIGLHRKDIHIKYHLLPAIEGIAIEVEENEWGRRRALKLNWTLG